jgi:hypothetical protein
VSERVSFWYGTKSQYDRITKTASTLFFITDTGAIYKGSILIADKVSDQLLMDVANHTVTLAALQEEFGNLDKIYASEEELSSMKTELSSSISNVSQKVETNWNDTIISLSVQGRTVTYIKGDGTSHSFETQDTNTEYFLATDKVTGLTKLYSTTGNAEDGTMTQKAITEELNKKVGVSVAESQQRLIFTK